MPGLKLAYLVATPDLRIPEGGMVFQGDFFESFSLLKKYDFDGMEMMVRDPSELNLNEIDKLSRDFGIEIPVICTGEIYGRDRLSFMDPDEDIRIEALERTKSVIQLAAVFGAKVNIGRLRGKYYSHIPKEISEEWMYSAFARISEFAEKKDVILILEPATHIYTNCITSTQQGIDVVKKVGSENFRLMADLFHMNLEDKSMEESFRKASPYLEHIHLCDSNRCPPGMGVFDFPRIIDIIKDTGYRGYVSAEVFQEPDQYSAIAMTSKALRPIL